MNHHEQDPDLFGEYPAIIDQIPGERRIDEQGSNLDGVRDTLDDMHKKNHPLLSHIRDTALHAVAFSTAEGKVIRWVRKHKKGVIIASEIAAVGVTTAAVAIDVFKHIRKKRRNEKNANNSH